ncbi:MAG TPA: hypothetical protein VK504_30085 [Vicinamibacterales bacterium]|nr:hypothetical protein [Vicinamibacterales bacterium]
MKTLFALNDLRQLADHVIRTGAKEKFVRAIEAFGIDETEMKTGWGLALDRVYDRTADALTLVRHQSSRRYGSRRLECAKVEVRL